MSSKGTFPKFGPSSWVVAASQNLQIRRLELRVADGAFRSKPRFEHLGLRVAFDTSGAWE
jgi:hypothetical protein